MVVFLLIFNVLFNLSANADTSSSGLDAFMFSGGSFSLSANLEFIRHPVPTFNYIYETPENNVRQMSGNYNFKSQNSNLRLFTNIDVYVGDKVGKVQEVFEKVRNITNDPGLYSAYPKQGFNYVKLNGDHFEFQIKCTNEHKKNVDQKKCYAINPEICSAINELKKDWDKVDQCRETLSKAHSQMMKGEEKAKQQWEEVKGNESLLVNKYAGKSREPFTGVELSAMNSDHEKIFEYLETVDQMCDPAKAKVAPGQPSGGNVSGNSLIPQ